MMIDQNIVAVSPSSVYRVLAKAGLIRHWAKEKRKKDFPAKGQEAGRSKGEENEKRKK
jgi:uncharacterized protein YndB with AHSA1/START domain